MPDHNYCPYLGKIIYHNQRDALIALNASTKRAQQMTRGSRHKKARDHNHHKIARTVYHCAACNGFHFGRTARSDNERIREKRHIQNYVKRMTRHTDIEPM